MNWWAILGYSSHACAKILCYDDVIYTDYRVPRTVTLANRLRISRDVPYFGACVPSPGLGLPGMQNVPYFPEAKVKIF